jgi:hypothetical protein
MTLGQNTRVMHCSLGVQGYNECDFRNDKEKESIL